MDLDEAKSQLSSNASWKKVKTKMGKRLRKSKMKWRHSCGRRTGKWQMSCRKNYNVPKNRISSGDWSCSPVLMAQLEGMKGYESINTDQDVVEVLKLIQILCCRHDQNTDQT